MVCQDPYLLTYALLKVVVDINLFLAGDWSKRRRLQRESSDNLETPQVLRGGSRSPSG
jgi:hypothetical protein